MAWSWRQLRNMRCVLYSKLLIVFFVVSSLSCRLYILENWEQKIYSVAESDLGQTLRRRKRQWPHMHTAASSSSNDDRTTRSNSSIKQDILEEVRGNRRDLQARLPPDLHWHLDEAFKCTIFQESAMTPPVVFWRCCKWLLGCQPCMQQWFTRQSQTLICPLCGVRVEADEMANCVFRGLDELLECIGSLVQAQTRTDWTSFPTCILLCQLVMRENWLDWRDWIARLWVVTVRPH